MGWGQATKTVPAVNQIELHPYLVRNHHPTATASLHRSILRKLRKG